MILTPLRRQTPLPRLFAEEGSSPGIRVTPLDTKLDLLWLQEKYVELISFIQKYYSKRSRRRKEEFLIRALIKLKRTDEAIKEAENQLKKYNNDPSIPIIYAFAATGDVERTIRFTSTLLKTTKYIEASELYESEYLGPILKSPAFSAFREKFPNKGS